MSNVRLESQRWIIAIAAIIMQMLLGTVYAWSVFKSALVRSHGWDEFTTNVTFMICIFVLGLSAAFGGMLVDKKGPRFVATIGGLLFGIGTIVAGIADQTGSIVLLWLGYGLICGLGNGFGYVTPIATLIRWFPDRRGLVTGLAVMGFGAGAFLMGKIAPLNIAGMGISNTFYLWGAIFLIFVTGAAQFYKNPPAGWLPAGFKPAAVSGSSDADSLTFAQARKTPQWWMMWSMLFLNVTAGLGLISQLSPIGQELYKPFVAAGTDENTMKLLLAAAGGSVVAYSSIFNGLGRLIWSWVSDAIGRKAVFTIMFITQAVLYVLVGMQVINSYYIFLITACYLLACFGGGFATMPAFAADAFGPKYIGRVYGAILTAWGAAGVAGPFIFSAVKKVTGGFQGALFTAAALLVVGFILSIMYRKPAVRA